MTPNNQPATGSTPSPARLNAYLSQVLLRLFNASPGIVSYIESYRVAGATIELSLHKIPDEVVTGVTQAFGIGQVERVNYTKNGQPCVGFKATPTTDDLSALAVDDEEDHAIVNQAAEVDDVERDVDEIIKNVPGGV